MVLDVEFTFFCHDLKDNGFSGFYLFAQGLVYWQGIEVVNLHVKKVDEFLWRLDP